MSRIGKMPISVPSGVEVKISGQNIHVKGKLGELDHKLNPEIAVEMKDGYIVLTRKHETKKADQMWGLSRTLVNNMIVGVTVGFTINLEINGVGFRSSTSNKYLTLLVGFSHSVKVMIPAGIKVRCEKPTLVVIHGHDKAAVGQLAAVIRRVRPPEPYKGKGIKYDTEKVLRKEGKTK